MTHHISLNLWILSVLVLSCGISAFVPCTSNYRSGCHLDTSYRDHDHVAEDADCGESNNQDNRRNFIGKLGIGALTLVGGGSLSPLSSLAVPVPTQSSSVSAADMSWPLGKVAFSLLPLAGTFTPRATVEDCVVPDTIWTHDQVQGIVNVNVPVRQVVAKLSTEAGGGLLVYNPVAPTKQLLKMMKNLEQQHGPVRHIVLGTVALEHKATFGPFARQFPKATVWLNPGQWAFPVNLPIDILGVTQRGSKLRLIPSSTPLPSSLYEAYADEVPEWSCDFDSEVLGPLIFKSVGAFSETAMFHKPTQSLLVTDTVVSVTADPPPIIQQDPRAMLFHARDSIGEVIKEDTPELRKKGWRRMVQFGLVFFPAQIEISPFGEAIQQARNIDPSQKYLGEGAVPFSLYPWTWADDNADIQNFETISKGGELFCPPILTKLILDREPQRVLDWVDRVCTKFDFKRVIPSHLNNNVKATPKEFRSAFEMLTSTKENIKNQRPLAQDLALLQKTSDLFTDLGIVAQSKVCDGEPARVLGRFASMYN